MWIAHLSDTHLRPPGQRYRGIVDPAAALDAAVAQIAALAPRPTLVLHTGDVVEGGTPEEYALALHLLDRLPAPLLAIPGNHDAREPFRAAFRGRMPLPETGPLHYAATAGPLRLVALDVTVPGQHHGLATPEALAWLDATLAQAPRQPTLLLLHQPPFACGVGYLDAYACREAAALEQVVARHPAVERVLCGHVHRQMLRRFGNTLLCTAPSTATAIALRPLPGAEPASYLEPPSFLLHHWDGAALVTHTVPIGRFPGPFGFA